MRKAIIEDGLVINVVIDGNAGVECPEYVDKGWTYNGSIFTKPADPIRPLEEHKKRKIKRLRFKKDIIIRLCKVDTDKYFQSDDNSLTAMESRLSYLNSIDDTVYNSKTYLHTWRCSNNTLYSFNSREDSISILDSVIDKSRINWGNYNTLTGQILSCTTKEQVLDIDIDSGWVTMDITG